ncbi:hypothetical protein CCP4SC76_7480002 [Gammaproteobacteria bacterium]
MMSKLYECSFCGKSQMDVKKLILGSGVFICDECIGVCNDVIGNFMKGNTYNIGDLVCKKSGSKWHGRVVGFYSTTLTTEGYAVESDTEAGSVQIYPVAALVPWEKE